jgi:hypothetical protein
MPRVHCGRFSPRKPAAASCPERARQRDPQERALATKEREDGPEHWEVTTTLSCLGTAYGALEAAARQLDLQERALAIEEREYGPEHRNVAIHLVN